MGYFRLLSLFLLVLAILVALVLALLTPSPLALLVSSLAALVLTVVFGFIIALIGEAKRVGGTVIRDMFVVFACALMGKSPPATNHFMQQAQQPSSTRLPAPEGR